MAAADARETALLCVRFALEKKAYDLVLLEVSELSSLADYFLICTGRSDTQVQAIAHGLEQNLAVLGVHLLALEGYSSGQWAVMDFGDVIVHIFYEPVREFYDLERLWTRAPQVTLPEPYRSQARELRLAGAFR
ncbi:MAG: ribosome silencing factor [Deltaproteobacteria bacterium]|nr:ribosome silencing factor [Deltaproteobacteria bacterium]MBI3389056.1 ribosome silencing factor [Deltaproteobacteria bacterium]